jgi:hypothetical protein
MEDEDIPGKSGMFCGRWIYKTVGRLALAFAFPGDAIGAEVNYTGYLR